MNKIDKIYFTTGHYRVYETVSPTPEQIAVLESIGWRRVEPTERRWRAVVCPVNGEGYMVEVQVFVDPSTGAEAGVLDTGRTKDLPWDYHKDSPTSFI